MNIKTLLKNLLLLLILAMTSKLQAQIISTDPAPYCTVSATYAGCGTNDYINNFTFNTLSNLASGCNATAPYYSLWAQTTAVAPGSTYAMTVQGSATKPNGFGVWIDYNRDNDFLDLGEFVYFTPGAYSSLPTAQLWTANITIPTNASPGLTRLRVRGNWQNYLGGAPGGPFQQADACGNIVDWTETEDYNITIIGSNIVLPPIANFFPSQSTTNTIPADTVWINSPYDLVSTSTNTTRTYWDLPGVSPLLPGYSRGNIGWSSQQYIDTAKYNQKFRYTYNTRGFWPVRLLAINDLKRDSLRDSIVKYIWVDTPNFTPKPNFFSARRKIGIGDYGALLDITTGGPNQWYWSFDPPCNLCTTPPYFNNFFAGATDQNPLFFAGDPGKFTICLQAWNARGWDTICKKDYFEVINSINVCSGSGSTYSTEKEGYMFGPSGTGLSYTRSQVSGCPGLLLAPCADSIILWVDRLKMLPTDTLVIRNGSDASAPILRKLGGSNISVLPATLLQNGIRGGSRLFISFMVGTGAIPTPYDSAGFSIRWEIKAASYPKPTSIMVLQDTVFSLQPVLYSNASTGTLMKFAWDTDGNGVYDSSNATATRSFLVTTPQYKRICLVTYNCVGSDTTCKNVLFLPTTQKPTPRFDVSKLQGFNTDTFTFSDKSLYGPSTWKWTFTPATAQYLMGTTSSSKNPIMRFTQRTKYTVKLVVTNQYGSDSLTKVDYVNIGAYDQPYCETDINLGDGSIGITRVQLQTGIDTAVNAYSPCFQIIGGNQAANMYRGVKHRLSVARPATTSAMDRKAWIDFNMDGLFTADELVMNDMAGTTISRTDSILVSTTQKLGSTRMRIGVTLAGTTLNSSRSFMGVFRDYVVNFPKDTVRPTATLNGTSTFFTEIHKAYVDPGITATDNIEGIISAKYETIGSVDTSKVGPNYLKYIVRDLYDNVCDTLTRTVFVILNQTGPSMTLQGASQVYVEVYKKYNEPGFTAKDNQGNDITVQAILTSNLDTSKLGVYSNTYTIIDAFGLSDAKQRAITVGDTTRPYVSPKVASVGAPYVHQVGTAIDLNKIVDVTDNYWSRNYIDLTIQGSVDVNNVGSYFISYVARDNSGNTSNLVMLRVDVKDTKAPTLILNGVNPLSWEVKTPFVDPWVTPTDNYWPASTVVISRKGVINTNVLGEYNVWYIGTDPSGNKDSILRVVKIVDTTIPRIDLLNVTEVNLPRWAVYVDAPVALIDNYNTDAEMRTPANFFRNNSMPLNAAGLPFGDAPGLYSVRYKVKDLSGNESEEAVRRINVLPEGTTGVNELMNIGNFMSVYPNPSNGLVNLRLANAQSSDVKVTILDMLGNEIFMKVIRKDDIQVNELDLSNQVKGFYLMRIQSGDDIFVKKIQLN